jgi:hypothetical protein
VILYGRTSDRPFMVLRPWSAACEGAMKPEYVPLASAAASAIVAVLVAWLAGARAARLEVNKLRLATQQLAFSKLLETRIREYPKLFAMLSDLPKAAYDSPSTVSVDLRELLSRVNEWDSQYAVFLGPETVDSCDSFRQALITAVREAQPTTARIPAELLGAAARLELALRSDLGIHGFRANEDDLVSKTKESY